MIRKILVPIDFSPPSNEGLDYAVGMAKLTGARLTILHVIEPVQYATPADLFGAAANLGMLEAEQRRIAERELSRTASRLETRKIPIETILGTGSPAATIVRTADRLKADLVVMATHGRTGLTHLLLGSVAERVVRESGRPVLTVHPKSRGRAAARSKRRGTSRARPSARKRAPKKK